MTSAVRRNKLYILDAADMVQEVVEITVDSGTAKSVWPIRTKDATRTKDSEDKKQQMAARCMWKEVQHEVLGR